MAVLALTLNPIVTGMLVVLFVVISIMMMLVVLIQRPSGGGLSGAFGASSESAGQTAFGAKTGDALTTATIVIFVLFLACAVGLNYALQPPTEALAPEAVPDPTAPGAGGDPLPVTTPTPAPVTPSPADAAPPTGDAPPPEPATTDPATIPPTAPE
jgi:preprotein translocase subunit SecG